MKRRHLVSQCYLLSCVKKCSCCKFCLKLRFGLFRNIVLAGRWAVFVAIKSFLQEECTVRNWVKEMEAFGFWINHCGIKLRCCHCGSQHHSSVSQFSSTLQLRCMLLESGVQEKVSLKLLPNLVSSSFIIWIRRARKASFLEMWRRQTRQQVYIKSCSYLRVYCIWPFNFFLFMFFFLY